jgi:hypothetical protein
VQIRNQSRSIKIKSIYKCPGNFSRTPAEYKIAGNHFSISSKSRDIVINTKSGITENNYAFRQPNPKLDNLLAVGPDANNGDKSWRPYNLNKSDVEALTGISGGFGLTAVAASTDVPVVLVGANIVSNLITTAITIDAIYDYKDLKNPMPSDKAQLGLNLINYGMGVYFKIWTIPSAVISIIDLTGGFDSFYETFNR